VSKEARTDSLVPQARRTARPAQPSTAALTTTSWSPPGDLPVGDWIEQGRWLGAVGRASGWWIGDWIRYGNGRYGEKYGEAARLTGYDPQSLMNMAYVAGRYEPSRRREGLSFSHHAELAALSAADQELWLDRIEAGQLSVRALRFELREARRRTALRAARAPKLEPRCPHCGHQLGRNGTRSRPTSVSGAAR
jgi:hypothetical protein